MQFLSTTESIMVFYWTRERLIKGAYLAALSTMKHWLLRSQCFYLFIHSFIHSFIYLIIYLSIYLSVCLFIDWLLAFTAFTLYSIFYVIFKIMSIHWVSVTLANIVYPYFLLFSHRRVSLLNSDNFHELSDELIDEMFYALWHNLTIQIMFCF